jgi:hypothetical protein
MARDLAVRDVELEQRVARRQRHALDVGRVPGRHQMAAGIRFGFQVFDQFRNLVDLCAARRAPVAPLIAVHRPQLAVLVGPLVPDADAAFLQPFHVGVAAQEP